MAVFSHDGQASSTLYLTAALASASQGFSPSLALLAQDPAEGTGSCCSTWLGSSREEPGAPRLCLATERTAAPSSGLFLWGQHPAGPACRPQAGVMGLELWLGGWAQGLIDADSGSLG